jgi:predicted nuclease of restriction endonuclease-like (RecB) superfamily
MNEVVSIELYKKIKSIVDEARKKVNRVVNSAMVDAYWNIGRLIVEDEQKGEKRAEYGAKLLKNLSVRLSGELGKGFDISNLKRMRQFYCLFPIGAAVKHQLSEESEKGASLQHFSGKQEKSPVMSTQGTHSSLRRELTWTHYKLLIRIENKDARFWYMNEAADQNWSTRALERQINSLYYERLLISQNKKPVKQEAQERTSALQAKPEDFMKNPYVLEFLNIKDHGHYRESELEQAIIDKIQDFLLELGKGFAFVARQKRISTETKEFYIDLVFYNYHLKCFILIDLKTGELNHQDVGQMDMYVRMFDDLQRGEDDNPTVGLILCTEKDRTIVKYSVLNENKQLFASKYMLYLPSEEELARELEREKRLIEMKMEESRQSTESSGQEEVE